jgi:hypothetical protein
VQVPGQQGGEAARLVQVAAVVQVRVPAPLVGEAARPVQAAAALARQAVVALALVVGEPGWEPPQREAQRRPGKDPRHNSRRTPTLKCWHARTRGS